MSILKLIPFVANDKINVELLERDYLEFADYAQSLACLILNVNVNFEDHCLFE